MCAGCACERCAWYDTGESHTEPGERGSSLVLDAEHGLAGPSDPSLGRPPDVYGEEERVPRLIGRRMGPTLPPETEAAPAEDTAGETAEVGTSSVAYEEPDFPVPFVLVYTPSGTTMFLRLT